MDYLNILFVKIQSTINYWWPWFNLFDDIFIIQFFIICTYVYIYTYKNIYYVFLYTFINFFLMGIYLSVFQMELFTAFLWLIECSVLFVFLLLLFYINIKGVFTYTINQNHYYIFSLLLFIYVLLVGNFNDFDNFFKVDLNFYGLIDNYYESLNNVVSNDLFGFSISYYFLNAVEFLFIGFLLLIGSVVCVNLYLFNKNVRAQNVNSYFYVFSFFFDFTSFLFLRKQNLFKQGNNKPNLKIFKRK